MSDTALELQLARNYAALALDRLARPKADRSVWEAEIAELERLVGLSPRTAVRDAAVKCDSVVRRAKAWKESRPKT